MNRDEVLAWARERRSLLAARAAQRREPSPSQPPADGRVWLDVDTVALILGVSTRWVRELAFEDRLPHLRRGRRIWFLREHIEEVRAARAFERRACG